MADTPQEQRVKAATQALRAVHAARLASLPPPPLLPAFSTRHDGAVINSTGAVVYTPPQLPELGKKKGA
jgi:hypothetical protein